MVECSVLQELERMAGTRLRQKGMKGRVTWLDEKQHDANGSFQSTVKHYKKQSNKRDMTYRTESSGSGVEESPFRGPGRKCNRKKYRV